MNNYLITKATIGLKKINNKTIIYDDNQTKIINKNIKTILEYNCNYYGSSFYGRRKSSQIILDKKYKVPIMLEEKNNLVLIFINSIRKKECMILNVNKIINFFEENNQLKIICWNNYIFKENISKLSFEKLIVNSIKLSNILNYHKK